MHVRIAVIAALAAVVVIGCAQEVVEEEFEPSESHQRYRESLEQFGLSGTALARDWVAAAERALSEPVELEIPFQERAAFDPARAEAAGYRFEATQGQRITITIEIEAEANLEGAVARGIGENAETNSDEVLDKAPDGPETEADFEELDDNSGLRLFADVFRADDDDLEALEQVASYSEARNRLEFEPRRDNSYILRLQPELLRGGRYTVTIETEPSLSFPVEGHDTEDIRSFFGAPRDGGARVHEGVDVFAPRGTPVLASSPALVRRVGTRERGGKVVSLYDEERDLIYYYAHLDEQLAEQGARVEPGDVIGTVGNTGNARTTPPHLHFGIYEAHWNAVDPFYYLHDKGGEPTEPSLDPELIGAAVAHLGPERPVYNGLTAERTVTAHLGEGTVFRPVGVSGEYLRVRFADGGHGYVRGSEVSRVPDAD